MNWKSHLDILSNKIARAIGILNRLKHFIPLHVKLTIYFSLIYCHFNCGILAWGNDCHRITTLQKKCIRTITISKYNDHIDPLFSKLKLLKLTNIFNLQQLKFYYRYISRDFIIQEYFKSLNFVPNSNYHNYGTRHRNQLHTSITKKAFTKKCIRHTIPALINDTPSSITEKLSTHSLNVFSHYVKNFYVSKYNSVCSIANCYIDLCNRQ